MRYYVVSCTYCFHSWTSIHEPVMFGVLQEQLTSTYRSIDAPNYVTLTDLRQESQTNYSLKWLARTRKWKDIKQIRISAEVAIVDFKVTSI